MSSEEFVLLTLASAESFVVVAIFWFV